MGMDVQDYIQKPVLPGELIRRVKRRLEPAPQS
jgi:PleD family two-component response regulator